MITIEQDKTTDKSAAEKGGKKQSFVSKAGRQSKRWILCTEKTPTSC
jgi:hypothetical protein